MHFLFSKTLPLDLRRQYYGNKNCNSRSITSFNA